MALTHGVEFDATIFSSRYAENTQRTIIQDEAVRVVVHYNNTFTTGEIYQTFIHLHGGIGSCRHVGIVGPHQFYATQIHLFQFIEVGHPAGIFFQIVIYDFCTQDFAE